MSEGVAEPLLNKLSGAVRFCCLPLEGPYEGCCGPLRTLDSKIYALGGAGGDGKWRPKALLRQSHHRWCRLNSLSEWAISDKVVGITTTKTNFWPLVAFATGRSTENAGPETE